MLRKNKVFSCCLHNEEAKTKEIIITCCWAAWTNRTNETHNSELSPAPWWTGLSSRLRVSYVLSLRSDEILLFAVVSVLAYTLCKKQATLWCVIHDSERIWFLVIFHCTSY